LIINGYLLSVLGNNLQQLPLPNRLATLIGMIYFLYPPTIYDFFLV